MRTQKSANRRKAALLNMLWSWFCSLENDWKSKRLQNQMLGDEKRFVLRGDSRELKEKYKILMKWLAEYKDLFVDDYRTSEIDILAGNSLFDTLLQNHTKKQR